MFQDVLPDLISSAYSNALVLIFYLSCITLYRNVNFFLCLLFFHCVPIDYVIYGIIGATIICDIIMLNKYNKDCFFKVGSLSYCPE